MQVSEIAKQVVDSADVIATILKCGRDCELRIDARGLKVLEIRKRTIKGCDAVNGCASGYDGSDKEEHVNTEKTARNGFDSVTTNGGFGRLT